MMFCEKCGSILVPSDDESFECIQCGTKGDVDLSESAGKAKEVCMVGEGIEDSRATAEIACKKCGHNKAYYYIQQTRSADEAPTTFYECIKCKNRWREY